jgi:16S rRNA (guanine527-N7)-methyltransferase
MNKYQKYYELLEKWNRQINLISVPNFDVFIKKHIEDSKKLAHLLKKVDSVLDIGTGAGLPGIVIKIEKPDIEVVLIEATRKKVSFCEEVVRRLDLKGIDVVWGRAEDEGIIKGLGAFDATVTRATWNLPEYLKISNSYLKNGKFSYAMKGSRWREELSQAEAKLKSLGFEYIAVEEYALEDGETRAILSFKKVSLCFT